MVVALPIQTKSDEIVTPKVGSATVVMSGHESNCASAGVACFASIALVCLVIDELNGRILRCSSKAQAQRHVAHRLDGL